MLDQVKKLWGVDKNISFAKKTDQVKKLWGVDKNISFAKKTNADKWI